MAERRMFAKSIIDSDAFLDMPLSAQALYFHLSMRADDEGFVGNPKRIRSMIGASEDDLKLLIAKRFLLTFESGVVVIKHWRIHNYIQNDRCKPTTYVEEKLTLGLDDKKAYTEIERASQPLDTKCIQSGSKMYPQVSIGKVSIAESSLVEEVSKKESKERDINSTQARVRESYEDIMNDMCVADIVRPKLWEFIQHCQLNGKTLTNSKLADILIRLDFQSGDDDMAKIETLNNAINGGYYDIR